MARLLTKLKECAIICAMETAYRKTYRLRRAQGDKVDSIEVTFPFEVVEREARARSMSISEFLDKFRVVAQYNSFDGVHYIFEEIKAESRKVEVTR